MKVVGYSYPWDYLDDPGAPERATALGVDVVALAASYHSSRVVTPLHPTRRVFEVSQSAIYVPVREEIWRGHRLIPRQPAWTDEDDLFGRAQRQLADVGLEADAWIVLTHHDELGHSNLELVARNAFGDPYPYALCLSAPDVREYCFTLVDEIVLATTSRGVVLEACGAMGVDHASQHDKSEFASWSVIAKHLLSFCFCLNCRRGLGDRGIDVEELARRVRAGVDGDALSVPDAVGNDLAEEVASFRGGVVNQFREALVQRIRGVRPDATVTLHGSANRWATGSFAFIGDAAASPGVTAVANCWDPSSGEYELQMLHALMQNDGVLGAYLRLDQGWSDDAMIEDRIDSYVRAGMKELHLYHLGLLSRSGLGTAARVVRAATKYTDDYWTRRRPADGAAL